MTVSPRVQWAVETLAVESDDHILEIGSGPGIAVDLICARLGTGQMTAIDRSLAMCELARKRNRAHITTGKATILHTALHEASFQDSQFTKIFAVNVNLFWLKPQRELNLMRPWLTLQGRIYLFYQPPAETKIPGIVDRVQDHLQANGYAVLHTRFAPAHPVHLVCIVGAPVSDSHRVVFDKTGWESES